MDEIRVAVLGMGFIGRVHAYAYAALPFFYDGLPFRARLKAVYNRTLATAQAAKESYGFEFATDDMRGHLSPGRYRRREHMPAELPAC